MQFPVFCLEAHVLPRLLALGELFLLEYPPDQWNYLDWFQPRLPLRRPISGTAQI